MRCVTSASVSCRGSTLALLWWSTHRLPWDLLCSEKLGIKPRLSPMTCYGLAGAKAEVSWGEAAHGLGRFGGQRCTPWAVGWAWVSWVVGLSSKRDFARFRGPAGVPNSNWLLLLSSPSGFLVKLWEDKFWKSLCVDS